MNWQSSVVKGMKLLNCEFFSSIMHVSMLHEEFCVCVLKG